MIEGHQRMTCVFIAGCNNIEIRTCEVVVLKYETRVVEIGFTSCSFGNAKKILHHWILALPQFKELDIIIHDGNKCIMSVLKDIQKPICIYEKEEIHNAWLVDDVYYTAKLGRWKPHEFRNIGK